MECLNRLTSTGKLIGKLESKSEENKSRTKY